jgi:hypothetical protein
MFITDSGTYIFIKNCRQRFFFFALHDESLHGEMIPVPKIIDPVFAKTSPNRSFCMTENERFGLVFVKTGSINSGTEGEPPNPVSAGSPRRGESWTN